MLVFIWFCVMTQAFMPNGHAIADAAVSSIQNQVRDQIDRTPTPVAVRSVRRAPALAR
jgi:hypothetical protein